MSKRRKPQGRTIARLSVGSIEEANQVKAISDLILSRRKELGITQRDLSAMCEISQSSIARIEDLRATPNLFTLLKLFPALGLELRIEKVPPTKKIELKSE